MELVEAHMDVNSAKLQLRYPPGRVAGLLVGEMLVVVGVTWAAVILATL